MVLLAPAGLPPVEALVRWDPAWLAADLTWFSGAAGRELTRPRALIVAHIFNHQTHHRGQVHAALTAAGQRTGDLDLPFILPDAA